MISPTPSNLPPCFLALIRHGEAARSSLGEPDSERALTPLGRERFLRQVARLGALGFGLDHLWTSPWRRARETALLLQSLCSRPLKEHPGLCTELESPPGQGLIREARERASAGRIALVGHEPWIADLAREFGGMKVEHLARGELVLLAADSGGPWHLHGRWLAE